MSSVKLRSVSRLSTRDDGPEKNIEKDDKITPVGPFTRFVRGVKGYWDTTTTVDTDTDEDREEFIRTTLRELLVYLGFVLTVCLIAFLMLDSTMFYLTNVMQGLFVDGPEFDGITNMEGFWNYVENGLIDGLHKEQYYDGADVHHTEIGYIFFENKLFGKPRLRQLRVRNDTCEIHPLMNNLFLNRCYGPYHEDNEEQTDFRAPLNSSAFVYHSGEELNGRSFLARMATYGGGGYTQLLGDTKQESAMILSNLKQNLWLDRGTRAVFIDFTVYNANINMFNLVRLVFEFTPTGGCMTYRRFSTIKLLRYVTSTDYFVMALEGILFLYLMFYTIEEILEIKKMGRKYLKDFWSLLDFSILIFGFTTLGMNLYRTFKVKTVLKDILDNRDYYANFELLQYWQELFNDFVAVLCFFAWIKIFKFISFNTTMAHLQGTLSRCAADVAAFTVMFLIVFFGFAHWGYLCFGRKVRDYNDFVICLFTLFRIILGDFSFADMYEANWTWGPIYFICYIFFVFFILLNMFLAIINDTYAEVKEDMDDEELEIGDIFKKGYDKMLNGLALKKNNIDDIRKALLEADINMDGIIDFEEWKAALKLRGHHDKEIESVFAKYDLDGDRVLNEEEVRKMQEELDEQNEEVEEEMEEVKQKKAEAKQLMSKLHLRDEDREESDSEDENNSSDEDEVRAVTPDEFKALRKKVDLAEHSVGSIVSKMEQLLNKLETMDKAKAKRRETMARLIDSIAEYEDKVENASLILAANGSENGASQATIRQGSKLSLGQKSTKGSSLNVKSTRHLRKDSKTSQGSKLSMKFDK